MKIAKQIICFLLFPASVSCFAQEQLSGKVIERDVAGKETPLGMAGVRWMGTSLTATSDEKGIFFIGMPDSFPSKLIVSMIGYTTDTVLVRSRPETSFKIILKNSAQTLSEVKILGKQSATSNLTSTTLNTELLSRKELENAACCNLSESFDRNASVDVNFTDAVSGTKQIQMLGLDGIYTQILYEYLPFVRGLSASHGLTYIPGPWVESIAVTKGTGSVVNGYESITGQIQIEMLDPDEAPRFSANAYANSENRFELNTHIGKRFSESLSTLLFAHASSNKLFGNEGQDRNSDRFMDMPLTEQYNIFNRWNYRIRNRAEGQFGFRFLTDDRTGGQIHNDIADTSKNYYNIGISTKQVEVFSKNGLLFPEQPGRSVALMTMGRIQQMSSFFGKKRYEGEQMSLYINTIAARAFEGSCNKIKYGLSMTADDFKETFYDGIPLHSDSVFTSGEVVPGGYAEYTFSNDSNVSVVAGLRGDHLDDLGLMVNPRLHIKYNPTEETVLRLSGGRGFRTPHIFVENSQLFASSREIIIKEKLEHEVAWNYGASFTYCWENVPVLGKEVSFNIDFFRTDFQQQVVADLEDPDKVQFSNLNGTSYSNSVQADLNFAPLKGLDIKMAYKYYNVKTTYSGTLLDKPLVPKDRALLNIDYSTAQEKWKFNFTTKWFGHSRLPNTSSNPVEFRLPERSPSYYTFMAQATKRFRWIELYAGIENLLDYRIENPIIDPSDPYGTNFDATMIWGPVNGRVIYGGIRYKIL